MVCCNTNMNEITSRQLDCTMIYASKNEKYWIKIAMPLMEAAAVPAPETCHWPDHEVYAVRAMKCVFFYPSWHARPTQILNLGGCVMNSVDTHFQSMQGCRKEGLETDSTNFFSYGRQSIGSLVQVKGVTHDQWVGLVHPQLSLHLRCPSYLLMLHMPRCSFNSRHLNSQIDLSKMYKPKP